MDALTDARRRQVLAALLDRSGAATERRLAAEIAADEGAPDADAASADEAQSVRVRLRHADLPKLADAGLVEWDRAEETVSASDHPLLQDAHVAQLLERDGDRWDDVIRALSNGKRRAILGALASRDGDATTEGLARDVAAREADGEPSEEAIEAVATRLHHVHLPKLASAGLIGYDHDAGSVTSLLFHRADGADEQSSGEPPQRWFTALSSVVG